MPTPRIVEPFDVIKHVCTDFVPGGVLPAVQALAFDRREEALDRRVVPAVPPPAASDVGPVLPSSAGYCPLDELRLILVNTGR